MVCLCAIPSIMMVQIMGIKSVAYIRIYRIRDSFFFLKDHNKLVK